MLNYFFRQTTRLFALNTKTKTFVGLTSTLTLSSMPVKAFEPRTIDDIPKSQQDDRLYRGLVLENGLQVLLVSDPKTDKSAAALDVNVGHLVDPRELPGLAHFCEHMLFMGTEKYPDENEYSKYLSQHGGSSNAYTSGDHTNYYFDVSPKHLEGALDRFSQFFLTPLFTESATDREVKAVNSEHEKNIPSDTWRIKQLEHSLSDPSHDYNKFGTGNKQTLDEIPKEKGINVRDELLEFHKRWYSSNIMGLTVLGKETLDELEAMVRTKFTGVENKNVEVPSWEKHPFRAEDSQTLTYIVPVKDIRNLNITFPIPDLHPYYKTGPGHYLGHLIGHEGKGSLLSELKARGWASSLVGGQKHGSKGFGFFVVNVDLSLEGMKHIDDIVSLVFQYLKMLRQTGPLEWVFDECVNVNKMLFRFKDKERPQGYACGMANNLHDYPLEECLTGGYLLTEWDPEIIKKVLDKLTIDNVYVAVIAQEFEESCTDTEEWYGTKYKREDIPKEKLEGWRDAEVHENLKIPEKNDFIPTNFELAARDPEKRDCPLIVKETPLTRLWFKQDQEFLLPKATVNFEFMSPVAYLDPHHANLTCMFVQLFKDDLNEYVYMAELAGLAYSLSNTKHGINLSIRGYNEKQHMLLEKIINKMVHFKVDGERFKVLKESYERGLKNFKMEQPYQHAIYYNSVLLAERVWEKEELLEVLDRVTVEEIEQFIPRLLQNLHIECLVHGNTTEEQAKALVNIVEEKLEGEIKVKPLAKAQLVKDREIALAKNSHSVFKKTNSVHKSSCIETYYQSGPQSTKNNMVLELLAQLINEPCFNVLRTKEQLGYIVFSGFRRSCGVQGLRVIVQSEKHPDYLDGRIEEFLSTVRDLITDMSDEEFENNKTALADKRMEKPKKLSSKTAKYWSEIASQQYNFNRDQVEVEALKDVTKEDVLAFYDEYVSETSDARRKLACHVVSEIGAGSPEEQTNGDDSGSNDVVRESKSSVKPEDVVDPVLFRSRKMLHPMIEPFVEPVKLRKDDKVGC